MSHHQTILHAIKTTRLFKLNYTEKPVRAVQRRLQGRISLWPDIDLKSFTTRAVIDWLDIQFTTGRKTQGIPILKCIEKAIGVRCFAKPLDQHAGRLFRVRFQEPDLKVVFEAVAAIRNEMGIDGDVCLAGLEVSIDFTPKEPGNDGSRAQLLAVLTRHFLPGRDILSLSADRPRFTWGDIGATAFMLPPPKNQKMLEPLLFNGNDRQPYTDATVYYGKKEAHCSWRIMDKIIDKQNIGTGTQVILPCRKRRVRIEVTLTAEELVKLDLHTLDDLPGFKFTKLTRYFRFLLPTFATSMKHEPGAMQIIRQKLTTERITKFLITGVVGLQAMDKAWAALGRVYRKEMQAVLKRNGKKMKSRRVAEGPMQTFIAFDDLNGRVEMVLRKLTERVRKQGT